MAELQGGDIISSVILSHLKPIHVKQNPVGLRGSTVACVQFPFGFSTDNSSYITYFTK